MALVSTQSNSRKTILVVDDEDATRVAMAYVLKASGYTTVEACNGDAAVKAAKEHHVDLVIMDISMPVLDGIRATRVLKKNPETASIPIVMLTASSRKEDVASALQAGAADYLLKTGFSVDALLARAARAIEGGARAAPQPAARPAPAKSPRGVLSVPTAPAAPAVVAESASASAPQDAPSYPAPIERAALLEAIKDASLLPAADPIVQEIALLAQERSIDRESLIQLTVSDPAMTVGVLHRANSVEGGAQTSILEVEAAVARIGVGGVGEVLQGLARLPLDRIGEEPTIDFAQFWRHSRLVAATAEALARRLATASPAVAYVAGLLHDVGRIVLLRSKYAGNAQAVLGTSPASPGRLIELEQLVIGATHAEIGANYLAFHSLPAPIVDAVRHHHAAARTVDALGGVSKHLTYLVQAANDWCKARDGGMHPLDDVNMLPVAVHEKFTERGVAPEDLHSSLTHIAREVETDAAFRSPRLANAAKLKPSALNGAYVCAAVPELDPIARTAQTCLSGLELFSSINSLIATGKLYDVVIVNLLYHKAPGVLSIVRRWAGQEDFRVVPLILILPPQPEELVKAVEQLGIRAILVDGAVRTGTLLATLEKVK